MRKEVEERKEGEGKQRVDIGEKGSRGKEGEGKQRDDIGEEGSRGKVRRRGETERGHR